LNNTLTQYAGFLDILKHLIRIPSVVGDEHPFFLSLKREHDELGIKTTLYEGLLVAEGSEPERGMISAQLDNVFSAAVIIYLYSCGYTGTAFFTAQEEAGKSWRFLLEWFRRHDISTDRLLVLDTSPYINTYEAQKQHLVLRNRDANAKFDSPLTKEIEELCNSLNISFSFKDSYLLKENERLLSEGMSINSLGSTEMGRIIVASEGSIQGTTLQIPTTGYHTTSETLSVESASKMLELLKTMYIDK